MMLVGFGYLMAFLKCYGLGAVGFTFVITCLTLQAHSHKDRDTLLSTNLNQNSYSPTTSPCTATATSSSISHSSSATAPPATQTHRPTQRPTPDPTPRSHPTLGFLVDDVTGADVSLMNSTDEYPTPAAHPPRQAPRGQLLVPAGRPLCRRQRPHLLRCAHRQGVILRRKPARRGHQSSPRVAQGTNCGRFRLAEACGSP